MRFADHTILYRRLGLNPNRHLPPEGTETQLVNVADERCAPLMLPVYVSGPQNGAHRVIAKCPCGRLIPIGRLGQHRIVRVERRFVVACDHLDFACREADQTR
jgi:hypothetical protein